MTNLDMTLRMNRAPAPFRKTVTLAAVVTDPDLFDTYTGTGLIEAHTSDSGHTYSELYGDPLTAWELDGAGNLSSTTDNSSVYLVNSWTAPVGDYYMETTGTLDAGASGGFGGFSVFGFNNGTDVYGFEAYMVENGGAIHTNLYVAKSGETYNDSSASGAALGVEHTIRIDVTNSGQTFTLSLDGVALKTKTMAGVPTAALLGQFLKCGADHTTMRVTELRGDPA